MSAELGQVESQLRREIENLEKERREGDKLYESRRQAIAEARDRIAAARGDGDKVTMIKEELKAKVMAQKKETLAAFQEQNDHLITALENQLEMVRHEMVQVHDDKVGQQKIFLVLREHGIDEFQNYTPGVISDVNDDEDDDGARLNKQPSFSADLATTSAPADQVDATTEATLQVAVAGDVDDDMYDEVPAAVAA